MQVTDITRSKRLYELSGWGSDRDIDQLYGHPAAGGQVPAYDCGYLLEKLPDRNKWIRYHEDDDLWYVSIKLYDGELCSERLVDALADLAIALFEEGILRKG